MRKLESLAIVWFCLRDLRPLQKYGMGRKMYKLVISRKPTRDRNRQTDTDRHGAIAYTALA